MSMFNLLGWKLLSDKLIDYHTMCKVLGVEFDFKLAGEGLVAVRNTEDRTKELCDQLDLILDTNILKIAEGERLRGRLQFGSGQLFGRSARNSLRTLSKHIASNHQRLCEETSSAHKNLRHQPQENMPRTIRGPMSDHIHMLMLLLTSTAIVLEWAESLTPAAVQS